MTINIEHLEVNSGEKKKGYIQFGTDTDGSPINVPILIAKGKKNGPTMWVHGCIHGEEYGGAASIIRLFQKLDVDQLSGVLIGIPVVNIPSFKDRNRISSMDGANLNRVFPGNPDGTYSDQLAHGFLELIEKHADYVIDLHSGGIGAEVPFYMIVKDDGTKTYDESLELAKQMGANVIWRSTGELVVDGTITGQLVERGIPTVTVECGGGNVTVEHENLFKNSILDAMKAVKMFPGEPPVFDKYTIVSNAEFFFTKYGGLFVPNCKVGDFVDENDLIGTVMDLQGNVLEKLRCAENNAYIAAIGHRYWPTEPGQLIAEAIPVVSEETFNG